MTQAGSAVPQRDKHHLGELSPLRTVPLLQAAGAPGQYRAECGLIVLGMLLLSERTTYSQTRRVIEFAKILYRGDRYRYFAKLTR